MELVRSRPLPPGAQLCHAMSRGSLDCLRPLLSAAAAHRPCRTEQPGEPSTLQSGASGEKHKHARWLGTAVERSFCRPFQASTPRTSSPGGPRPTTASPSATSGSATLATGCATPPKTSRARLLSPFSLRTLLPGQKQLRRVLTSARAISGFRAQGRGGELPLVSDG